MQVKFVLNGHNTTYEGNPDDRLLDALRDTYGLTSVKCGCREGECGACAVLIDGTLKNSCLIAMGAIEGSSVITLEGYMATDRFKCIDRAFSKFSALQCGFCTPGMILAAEYTLRKYKNPTKEQIREGMSGNLCRCTGYNAIVNAVYEASKEDLW